MNKNLLFTSLLLFGLYIFVTQCVDAGKIKDIKLTDSIPKSYTPFPPGFNYPLNRDTIEAWIKSDEYANIREHAIYLFAGLNQEAPNGQKIWQTWYPVSEVIPKKNPEADPEGLKKFVKIQAVQPTGNQSADTASLALIYPPFPIPVPHDTCSNIGPGRLFFFSSFIVIPSTYYNQAARDWIKGKNLGAKSTLDSLHDEGLRDLPHAPSDAIIVKHVYWPVSGDPNEYAPLPVWDGSAGMNRLAYNGFETWKRAVAITTNPNPPNSVDVTYLFGYPNRNNYHYEYKNAKTVSIDNFYHLKLDKENLARFNAADTCIINNSFYHVFNRPFKEGDYLVSIGTHIMTKEIEHWTMQTAWWHDQPNDGPYAENRPVDIPPGPWQNYLMSPAYFMAVPNLPSGKPHIGFNPYIELTLPEQNRINSNCQNCHIRAAWPMPDGPFQIADIVGQPVTFPTVKTPFYNSLREGFIGENDPIFQALMRTDMNWGIPDRAQ